MNNVSHYTASGGQLQQQDVLAAQSLQKAQAQFDTALQASVFDDQQAFLAALMDEQTLTQLEQLKQIWKTSAVRRKRWSLRQQKRWHSINNTDLTGWLSL